MRGNNDLVIVFSGAKLTKILMQIFAERNSNEKCFELSSVVIEHSLEAFSMGLLN